MLAAVLFAACEKQIDIDIEEQSPRVVVMGQNEVDEPVAVDLTYSRPIFGSYFVEYGEDYFKKVTDATVTLRVDGSAAGVATQEDGRYTFAHRPQPGETLELTVDVQGQPAITATAVVPNRPQVADVSVRDIERDEYDDNATYGILTFTLSDDAASADYYSVRLLRHDTTIITYRDEEGEAESYDTTVSSRYVRFSCTDYMIVNNTNIEDFDPEDPTASSTYYGWNLLFTDAAINGMSHKIDLDINITNLYYDYDNPYYGEEAVMRYGLTLEVVSLSRDHYLYQATKESYNGDAILDFFTEPVQIHSNIQGGIGIFGVASKSRIKVNVPTHD